MSAQDPAGPVGGATQRERDAAAAALSPLGVLLLDRDGRVLDLDADATALLGGDRRAALGIPLSDLLPHGTEPGSPAAVRLAEADPVAACLDRIRLGEQLAGASIRLPVEAGGLVLELAVRALTDAPVLVATLRRLDPSDRRRSEWFHRALVAYSPVAMLVFDAERTLTWCSPAGAKLVSGGLHDPGAFRRAVHPDDLPAITALYDAVQSGPAAGAPPDPENPGTVAVPVEIRVRGPEHSWVTLAVAAENLLGEPAVRGVAVYATDISRALAAEHRALVHNARLETLLGALRVGILVEDEKRRVVLTNSALSRILRIERDPDELVGQVLADTVPLGDILSDIPAYVEETTALAGPGVPASGREHTLTDGTVIVRDYAPIEAGGDTIGTVWVVRDVTAEVHVRRNLEDRNRALAEIAHLKTEFVSAASHELRTPLTSILTFSQMLNEESDIPADQERLALGAISRNATRTLKIVDQLLDLAGLEGETRPLTKAAANVPALVREAVDSYADAAVRAGVTLSLHQPRPGPMLRVDGPLLRQAVEALLGAVAAARPAGSLIEVTVTYEAGYWLIQVGSPAMVAGDHLFTTGSGGTGNALSFLIARAIVSRHGGELDTPATTGGNTFAIRLPLRPAKDPGADGAPVL